MADRLQCLHLSQLPTVMGRPAFAGCRHCVACCSTCCRYEAAHRGRLARHAEPRRRRPAPYPVGVQT